MKTSKEIHEELSKVWNINELKFHATFMIDKKGNGIFTNLRRVGDLQALIFPDRSRIIIKVAKGNLLENNNYIIKCFVGGNELRQKLNREYILALNKNFLPKGLQATPQDFVQKLQEEYGSAKGIVLKGLTGAVKRITYDINKKPETFIFELLQNADDYPDKGKDKVNIRFKMEDSFLILTHNGLPFAPNNVEAICTIDSGDKQYDFNKTGYKGIGFKSVFKYSNYVVIHSGGFCFRFDEVFHTAKGLSTFWQLIPIWTNDHQLQPELNKPEFKSPNVSIAIRPKLGNETLLEIEEVFKRVFQDDRVLLFLRHVESLNFQGLSTSFTKRINRDHWLLSELHEIEVSEEIRNRLNTTIEQGTDDRIPEKYKDLFATKLTFATELENGSLKAVEASQIFSYLPTDLNLGFPFLLNGDFIPDGGRHYLHADLFWNQFLFEKAGYMLFEWLKHIYKTRRDNNYLLLIPDIADLLANARNNDEKLLLESFKMGMQKGLAEVAFIPTRSEEMKPISEVIIDTIGLLDCFEPTELDNIFITNKNFIDSTIRNTEILIRLINTGLVSALYYNLENFHTFLSNPFYQIWLNDIKNQKSFHNTFNAKGFLSYLASAKVYLGSDGALYSSADLYLDLSGHEQRLGWLGKKTVCLELKDFYLALAIPFKKWDLIAFLDYELSKNLAVLNEHLRFKEKNKSFFEFLAHEIDQIPSRLFSNGEVSLRKCWLYQLGSKMLTNTVEGTQFVTVYSEQFKDLIALDVLPRDAFVMIEKFYLELHPEFSQIQKLFNQLGIIHLKDTRYPKRIFDKLLYYQNVINAKKRSMTAFNFKAITAQSLWAFINTHWPYLTNEERKLFRPRVMDFLVLADNGNWMPLGEVYLGGHYSGDSSIDILAQQFPELKVSFLSHHLITEQYSTSYWKECFERLPIKKNIYTLLEQDVWPKIKDIPKEKLPAITYQFMKNADKLIQAGIHLKEIPLLNARNEKSNDVVYIGKEFLEENFEDQIFPIISIKEKISGLYLEYGTKKEWVTFLVNIGRIKINSINDAAFFKISEYRQITNDAFDINYNKQIFISLWENKDILEHIWVFKSELPVLTSNGIKPSESCYLSSAYTPRIDLQKLENSETINFISEIYLEDTRLNQEQWKDLFIIIGIKENLDIELNKSLPRKSIPESFKNAIDNSNANIRNDAIRNAGKEHYMIPFVSCSHIETIVEPEVNRQFWKHSLHQKEFSELLQMDITYKFANSSFSFINYIHWYLKYHPSVLNNAGQVVIPKELYRYGLQDSSITEPIFPEMDFDDIKIGGSTLEQFLGLKMEPDFFYVVNQLLGKINVVRNNDLWTVFKSGMDRRNKWTTEEQTAWITFCFLSSAPNRFGQWVSKDQLFILDTGHKADITANHPCVLFSKIIPYAQELGVSKLSKNDFNLNLPESNSDTNFTDVLKKRLPYFAFFAAGGGEKWLQYLEILEGLWNELRCAEVKRIEWVCQLVDPKIVYSEEHYIFHEGIHYHVGRWNSMRASPFQKAMYTLFKFEGSPLRFEYYCDFLEMTPKEIVDFLIETRYKVPDEWLSAQVDDIEKNPPKEKHEETSIKSQPQDQKVPEKLGNGTSNNGQDSKSSNNFIESELTSSEVVEIKALLGQSLSDDEKENAWLIAFFRAIKWYKEQGYDTSQPQLDYDTARNQKFMVAKAPDEEKSIHRILVRSARNGILRLKYNAWLNLMDKNAELFVLTGNKSGEHKIFKTQEELILHNKDSIITKLDATDKYAELESLLRGEYKKDRTKIAEFTLMIRMEGFKGFKSIFESIYQKEGKHDINEDDLDID